MSHLGRWLSAQVDGELDGIERDRVLNHVAGCEACRDEANALRALKRRMTALGDSASGTAIASRLIELARSDEDLAAPSVTPHWAVPSAPAGPVSRQSWLTWRIASGSAGSALIAIGVIAFMLGGGGGGGTQQDRPVPHVTPAVDAYWTEHIFDTGELPGTPGGTQQSVLPVPGISGGFPGPFVSVGSGTAGPGSQTAPDPASRAPVGGPPRSRALIRLDTP